MTTRLPASRPIRAAELMSGPPTPAVDPRSHAGQRQGSPPAHGPTARPDDPIGTVARVMRRDGLDRMPVVEPDGSVVGIVTVDDILDLVARLDSGVLPAGR